VTKLLIVGIGGFIGAIARYGLSGLVHRYTTSTFPFGTLAVNVIGCLFIGVFLYLADSRLTFPPAVRMFIGIGLLGAFTTFSTFGFETIRLLGDKEFTLALSNIGANVFLGLGAVWLARTVLRMIGL
jgi:fluoride exporter